MTPTMLSRGVDNGRPHAWVALLALIMATLVACADGPPDAPDAPSRSASPAASDCACAPSAPVIDPALLAFLSKAKALHHQADLAEDDKNTAAAIEALERVVDSPLPPGEPLAVEVREVMADTLARSAELRSRDDYQAALKDINRGLQLASERSHYRGRLMEVLGVVEEREFKRLEAAGDPAAAAAKERALKALEEAVAIQDDVIKRALGDALPAPE